MGFGGILAAFAAILNGAAYCRSINSGWFQNILCSFLIFRAHHLQRLGAVLGCFQLLCCVADKSVQSLRTLTLLFIEAIQLLSQFVGVAPCSFFLTAVGCHLPVVEVLLSFCSLAAAGVLTQYAQGFLCLCFLSAITRAVQVVKSILQSARLCEVIEQTCKRPANDVEDAYLDGCPELVAGFLHGCELAAQLLHLVLHVHVGLCGTVGSGLHVVARLLHLLADDGSHGLGHVARLGHLVLDFGCTQSEVVEDHERLAPETRHYRVHHVIDRLPRVLGLLLGEGEHRAQFLNGQFEVVELHRRLHQFDVGHGAVGGLSQSVEDVAAPQIGGLLLVLRPGQFGERASLGEVAGHVAGPEAF